MVCNYPINIFDSCLNGNDPFVCDDLKYNNQTLGLKLERPEQIEQFDNDITAVAPYPVSSLNDYVLAMINLLMETLNRKTSGLQNEKGRTIYISYGNIFGKPRKVSLTEKKELINNGISAAEQFLNRFRLISLYCKPLLISTSTATFAEIFNGTIPMI
jgi:hypothetical protein